MITKAGSKIQNAGRFLRDGLSLKKLRQVYSPERRHKEKIIQGWMRSPYVALEPNKAKQDKARKLFERYTQQRRQQRNQGLIESGSVYGGLAALSGGAAHAAQKKLETK